MDYNSERAAIRAGQLIHKEHQDELSEAERLELHRWFTANPANQKTYEEIAERVGQKDLVETYASYKSTESLERLIPRLAPRTSPFKKTIIVGIAAALLLTLSFSLTIFFQSQPDKPQLTVNKYGVDVMPGSERAILTLGNGRVLELRGDPEGIVAKRDKILYADGSAVAQTEGASGSLATLTTPNGGQYKITLPDGTVAWLNAASTLTYPFHFSDSERHVQLTGEACFVVQPDATKPFIVHTPGQEVQVLGTIFNINAYGKEPAQVTTLIEGKVKVSLGAKGKFQILKPGQQAIADSGEIKVQTVDPSDFSSWKDGIVILNETPLPVVQRQIERWYDVEFVGGTTPTDVSLNGVMHRNTKLSGILELLEMNTGNKYKIEGRRIMVK